MKRILPALVLLSLFLLSTWAGVAVREQRDAAQATIRELQRRNAALEDRAAKWEKLAKDFEALNRQCLQITFGGGR